MSIETPVLNTLSGHVDVLMGDIVLLKEGNNPHGRLTAMLYTIRRLRTVVEAELFNHVPADTVG